MQRIDEITEGNPESLVQMTNQDAYILNLQRGIQACIDLANIVIKEHKWEMPGTYRESFQILSDHGLLDAGLCKKMQKMCGFRNIAIHDYRKIDVEILKNILTNDLRDLERFYQVILQQEKN